MKKTFPFRFHLVIVLIFIISSRLYPESNDPLIYGIVPDASPVSFIDKEGNPSGFIVELFTRIMTDIEIEYEIVSEPFPDIYKDLINKEVDLYSTMIKTEDREELFFFPDVSISGGWGQLFINENEKYESITSLRNKKIGMIHGDEMGEKFKIFMEKLDIYFIAVHLNTYQELFNMVQSGELYGGVIYSSYLLYAENIRITPTVFSPQPAYAVTALDGDRIGDIIKITEKLKELKADNKSYYYTLQNKWLAQNTGTNNRFNTILLLSLLILLGVSGFLGLNGLILKKTIQKRTSELKQSDTVFKHSNEGFMITDEKQKIIKVNKAFETMTGYKNRELAGKPVSILKDPHENRELINEIMDSLQKTDKWAGKTWDRKKNGEIYPLYKSIVLIRDKQGKPLNYSFVFSDMTENRDLENRIHYISNYDKQTNLPNKTLFIDRLIMAGMTADRDEKILCVISLGIDNFKKVNRSYGHLTGDNFLRMVGIRLKDLCRKYDTVSRYGGDEFTLLLTEINTQEDIIRIIEKIKREMERPFLLDSNEIFSSCTQGISLYPSDSREIELIPRNANQALHIAKRKSKGSYAFYKEEDDIVLKNRHKNETMLRSALINKEILVYYQPKFDIARGEINGVEALVRWNKNHKEIIYPDEFISILEESGLIISIGEYVLKQSCTDIADLNSYLEQPLKLAVNLSAIQFTDPGLSKKISRVLEDTNFPAELLEVEITESIAMNDLENTLQILDELTEKGIGIAVDDFGTGYSSLSYLKKFPLSTLKIDKSFIDEMDKNEEDQSIVKTIISLAKIMNLNVVAEGVETRSQIDLLKKNKCHEAQGFLISKPKDIKNLHKLLIKKLGSKPF